MIVARKDRIAEARRLMRNFRVVEILGARQVGKTTLALQVARDFAAPPSRSIAASTPLRFATC